MGFLAGDYTPHPNSLMFNAIPIFWPFKAYWFVRKVSFISQYTHTGCSKGHCEPNSDYAS